MEPGVDVPAIRVPHVATEPSDPHLPGVLKAIAEGRLVPFFGAGVHLCGRPVNQWERGASAWLPSGKELARHLAREYEYSAPDADDLLRVSEYVAVMNGDQVLYDDLHTIFDGDFEINRVHRFFASLPARLRGRGQLRSVDPTRRPLIITTNYDDVLERALRAQDERFHTVTYIASGTKRGRFLHSAFGRDPIVIEDPTTYDGLQEGPNSLILLKLHGAVDRAVSERDSFVVTEGQYIDYLTRTDLATFLPGAIVARMRRSQFLFLGYSLRDWNFRAMFHGLAAQRNLGLRSWAIQHESQLLDEKFWDKRDVSIIVEDLNTYMARLELRVQAWLGQLPEAADAGRDG
jgi:hypothetical protein